MFFPQRMRFSHISMKDQVDSQLHRGWRRCWARPRGAGKPGCGAGRGPGRTTAPEGLRAAPLPAPAAGAHGADGKRWRGAAGAVPRVPAGAAGRRHQPAPGPLLAGRRGRGRAALQAAAPLRCPAGEPGRGAAGGGPPDRRVPGLLPLPQRPRRRAEPGSRREERRGAGWGRRAAGPWMCGRAVRGQPGAEAGGEAPGRAAAAGHAGGLRGAGAGAGGADPAAGPAGVPRNPLPDPLGAAGLREGECEAGAASRGFGGRWT